MRVVVMLDTTGAHSQARSIIGRMEDQATVKWVAWNYVPPAVAEGVRAELVERGHDFLIIGDSHRRSKR